MKKNIAKKNRSDAPLGCSQDELQGKIQKKAYEIFTKRGYSNGNDLADWLEAERIVKSQSK